MPIDSTHREYDEAKEWWARCRDVIDGEDTVKSKATKYLPILGGQASGEYSAYKMRALFFGATSRTVQGLQGAVFRKDYTLEYPEQKKELLKDITEASSNIDVLLRTTVREILEVGRIGLLVDVVDDGAVSRAYIAQYKAENIINWQTDRINGEQMLTMVALQETYDDPDVDGHDIFKPKEKVQIRLLLLVPGEGGGMQYKQQVFRKSDDNDKWMEVTDMTVYPTRAGVPLDFIPFKFINADDDETTVDKPPLLDMVDVNLSHYRTSADLEHGAHFTALPTAVLAGFDPKKTYKIGSGTAWVTSNAQARAQFLEYTGQGLGALRDLKKDKEGMMAVLGARFLEEQKRSVEAAETLRVRASADAGTLSAMVGVVDDAMTQVLKWHAEWMAMTPASINKIQLVLNKDFVSARLTAAEIIALMKARQAGELSQDSFLHNLKEGEILPDGRTIEQEKDLIEIDDNSGGGGITDSAGMTPIKRQFELVRDDDGKATGIKEA